MTQPLLNYHYRSKDELWRAAVDALFAALNEAMAERVEGLRGVDELTTAKLLVREFVAFSATQSAAAPHHHARVQEPTDRGWTTSSSATSVRSTSRRPRCSSASSMRATCRTSRPSHLYYILTGAGPTMFVLAPECRRLAGIDPQAPDVVEAHADAVVALIFGH